MKLYYAPGACSLAAHIACEEGGLACEYAKVDLRAKKLADGGDYLAVNPKGSVPALVLDSGGVLTENAVVLQYLADQAPGRALAPAPGTFDRYRLAEWLNYIATEIHKGWGPLWNPQNPDAVKEAARKALAARFDYVGKRLASTPFLMGDTFTVADAYLFVTLNWAGLLKFDLAPWPMLQSWHATIAQRPAVQRAMRAEGLLP
ncbi:MAG: glutathione transferase GstA [Burkholderiales bacterium]